MSTPPRLAPLSGALWLCAVLPACTVHVAHGGYTFDYGGVSAQRASQGALPATLAGLDVEHTFGGLDVRAALPGEEAGWSWHVETWADDAAAAEAFAGLVRLDVSVSGERAHVALVLPEPSPELRGVRSELELVVPAAVAVRAANFHGDTSVSGVAGDVQAHMVHGDAAFADLGANCRVEHAHGDLRVARVAGELDVRAQHGAAELGGMGGAVHIEHAHGNVAIDGAPSVSANGAHGDWTFRGVDHLELRTSHGDVRASGVSTSLRARVQHGALYASGALVHVDVECAHGDAELELAVAAPERVRALVVHGDLDVRVPADLRAVVHAAATHGDVSSELASSAGAATELDLSAQHGDVRVHCGS